ncbi:hypothetical protein OM416_20215 [Paenibacillus sp. LS1]|uniref:hypothetical protein n=1 Tax=Paenibacillus sp. LS1 TaxID=2992120 RepID=UPI00222F3016|nr:hypothetical protein [Paenibacillus sp. LS1]MCW3793922.1 hypothetical protein [Paenibacillus sp. LS1]
MNNTHIRENYHSFLSETAHSLDPILRKMRYQDKNNWRMIAWTSPIKKLPRLLSATGKLSKTIWGLLSTGGTGVTVFLGFVRDWPIWLICSLVLGILFLVYYLMVTSYMSKMLSIASDEFHVGAYKAKRPNEYLVWSPLTKGHNATYTGLYDVFTLISNAQSGKELQEALKLVNDHAVNLKDSNDQFLAEREYFFDELEKQEQAISYLIGLIKDTNKTLYRMVNDCLDYYEFDFVSAFTIYEVQGDKLKKIFDKGTSGNSPQYIALTKENASRWSGVDVALNPTEGPKYNNPYPGRTIVSIHMKMLNEVQWIWNFHMDDSNDRALILTLGSDIIEVREVYRLVHAFCLILQKELLKEEGTLHDRIHKTTEG